MKKIVCWRRLNLMVDHIHLVMSFSYLNLVHFTCPIQKMNQDISENMLFWKIQILTSWTHGKKVKVLQWKSNMVWRFGLYLNALIVWGTLFLHWNVYKSFSLHEQHGLIHICIQLVQSTSSMHISISHIEMNGQKHVLCRFEFCVYIDKRIDGIMYVCKATTVCLICTTTMARLLPRTSVRKFLIYSPLCRITHQLVMWMWCDV